MIPNSRVDASHMALRLDQQPASLVPAAHPTAPRPADCDSTLRFDRRRESRAAVGGWARLICLDPFRSFLGGSVELADVSHTGFGFRSPREIPVGEFVEVQLAPFRVRGRIATVTRCDEVPAQIDETTGETITPRHFRIGVRHAQSIRAA